MDRNTNNNRRPFIAFGDENSWGDPYGTWKLSESLPTADDRDGSFQQVNTAHPQQDGSSTDDRKARTKIDNHQVQASQRRSPRFQQHRVAEPLYSSSRSSQPSFGLPAAVKTPHMTASSYQWGGNTPSESLGLSREPAFSNFGTLQATNDAIQNSASDSREDLQQYGNTTHTHRPEFGDPIPRGSLYGDSSLVRESTSASVPSQPYGHFNTTDSPYTNNTNWTGNIRHSQNHAAYGGQGLTFGGSRPFETGLRHGPSSSQNAMEAMANPAPFLPSRMALQAQGLISQFSEEELLQHNRYMSEVDENKVQNLPAHLNTALFITNIEDGCQYWQLFDKIHTGGVASLTFRPKTQNILTMAAILVFVTIEGARIFSREKIVVMGRTLRIQYSREGNRENPVFRNQSRVLLIEGPTSIMTREYWDTYFTKNCSYVFDRIQDRDCHRPGRHILEFRFVRIQGQSRMCLKQILGDGNLRSLGVEAHYGPDPCAVPELTNFGQLV